MRGSKQTDPEEDFPAGFDTRQFQPLRRSLLAREQKSLELPGFLRSNGIHQWHIGLAFRQ
jgi:hypothetical protein